MAGGSGKRGGADRVLESRHLVGLFLGVVLLCSVFFTLGYVMGRTQFSGPVLAETFGRPSSAPAPAPKAKEKDAQPPAPVPGEWDFYAKKDDSRTEPPPPKHHSNPTNAAPIPAVATKSASAPPAAAAKPVAAPAASTPAASKQAARYQPPKMGKGAIVVQVAALARQSDALHMADVIQEKQIPAFVVTPASDNFYRVQVGPYTDEKSAEVAKRALEQLGFKPIIKR
jgi:DedD protein